MIQAARSGKQNIVEGSRASRTSKQTGIFLTGVARASLDELIEDYKDYLRLRDLRLWDKNSKEALYVRGLGSKPNQSFEMYRDFVETRTAEVVANIAICLINQTNYLINGLIRHLEQDFIQNGGLRENMKKARVEFLKQRQSPHPPHQTHGAHNNPSKKPNNPNNNANPPQNLNPESP